MLFIIEYKARESYFFFTSVKFKQGEGKVGRAIIIASDENECAKKVDSILRDKISDTEDSDFLIHTGFRILNVSNGAEYSKGFELFMSETMPSLDAVVKKIKNQYYEAVIKDVIL